MAELEKFTQTFDMSIIFINFAGVKSPKFARFLTSVACESPRFRNGARYMTSKTSLEAPMIALLSFQIWYSSDVHSFLRKLGLTVEILQLPHYGSA